MNTPQSLSQFAKFSKTGDRVAATTKMTKTAVVYTRVSSKEQADKNLSLDLQRKVIEEYAARNEYAIAATFGGTYESAKTDGRKEFARMLDYVKKSKGAVSHILVYTLDRFSRTGGGAIKLAEELREKYGVTVFAVTQPADTSNPSGVLQQNIHFIFSQYDNQLRKQRAVAGMKEKFAQGVWATKPPMGFDIVRTNGQRRIVVNGIGRKLRKAFVWKAEGMKSEEIILKLRAMGLPMYKQQLCKILKNPFYCGLIAHGMLDGKVIEGTHEKLISKEVFLRVNAIHTSQGNYGVPHRKERNEVPLKVFVKCADCTEPFTGYVVKAKGLWYYKCRTKGCKCNKSAKDMHRMFESLLDGYSLKEHLRAPLQYQMEAVYEELNKEGKEQEAAYKAQLAEVEKKLDAIEEKYYVTGEMARETFDKFSFRYKGERATITKELERCGAGISNPSEAIAKALDLSLELATTWTSSDVAAKERLQKLVFPEGIAYDKKTGAFRTTRVNAVFELIAGGARLSEQKGRGQAGVKTCLSPSAEREGFEPSIPLRIYHLSRVARSTTPASLLEVGFGARRYVVTPHRKAPAPLRWSRPARPPYPRLVVRQSFAPPAPRAPARCAYRGAVRARGRARLFPTRGAPVAPCERLPVKLLQFCM